MLSEWIDPFKICRYHCVSLDGAYELLDKMKEDYRRGRKRGEVISRELYDYEKDPMETINAVDLPKYREVVRKFERISKG